MLISDHLTTIANCFKRAKISDKEYLIAVNDENGPFKELNEISKNYDEKDQGLMLENMTVEVFACADDTVITPLPLTDKQDL